MATSTEAASKPSDSVLSKSIPINRTDLSTFDDSFSFMKEKFAEEMRRLDAEMTKFSADLLSLYKSQPVSTGVAADAPIWENLANSPLIEGTGAEKQLKLQFDVSQFDPSEVKVQFINDVLVISATHEEKTENSSAFRELKREFILPKGTDPEAIVSSLSRDGVLTVLAPLPAFNNASDTDTEKDTTAASNTTTSTAPSLPDQKQAKKTKGKK